MSQTSPPSRAGVYVYGVTPAEPFAPGSPPLTRPGIGGRGDALRTVHHDDLAAIVSDSPEERYTLRREYVLAHEQALEEAMTRSDVLPVAFSTVARSDEEIREKLLKRQSERLHRYLEYVHGRAELGLKVWWSQERVFAEILAQNEQVRALQESIAGRSAEATYYDRIHLGELTEAEINLKRDQEVERIWEVLQALAADTRVNQGLDDMMILNAAFLVDKDREPAFDAKVQALNEAEAGRLTFQYVGPLPPYNFVTLNVRWED